MSKKNIEIAIPIYNEEEGIDFFLHELEHVLLSLHERYVFKLLFVNDASTDKTVEKIRNYKFKVATSVELIHLSKNMGHSNAINACIHESGGDALVLMDADMQDDPVLLQQFLREWECGADLVRVRRYARNDGFIKNFLYAIFYKIFSFSTGLAAGMGTYGLYSAAVVAAIRQYREKAFFLPGIVSSIGFSARILSAERPVRKFGSSKMGLYRLYKLAFTALFSFSRSYLHGIFLLAIFLSTTASAMLSIFWLRGENDFGFLLVLLSIFQALALGVLVQYFSLVLEEVKARPLYLVKNREEIL